MNSRVFPSETQKDFHAVTCMFCNLKDDVTELELPEKLAKKFRLFT